MKKYMKYFIFLSVICFLCGCSSKSSLKDTSYETELFGTYEECIDTTLDDGSSYYSSNRIQLNEDGTFFYEYIDDKNHHSDTSEYQASEINNDIIKITYHNKQEDELSLFKYKNMLGHYIKTEKSIPKSKHFNIDIPTSDSDNYGWSFTKDGLFHNCSDVNNCTCDTDSETFFHYERKGNVIYVNAAADWADDNWEAWFYIVDDGLFFPSVYKVEE